MDLGLRGRIAVVGGATSGLGRASAEALAAEGCDLLIWSRGAERLAATAAELSATHGVRVAHLAADALQPGAAADLVAWDAEHEGAFALRLGSVRPSRIWISGSEIDLSD